MFSVSIIGAGRLGGALALALSESGYRINELIYRNPPNRLVDSAFGTSIPLRHAETVATISSDVVFLTTQDAGIVPGAEYLASRLSSTPQAVFHTSGSQSSEILQPLRKAGCPSGSLHPLVSISSPELGKTMFRDAYFCVEGDESAVAVGEQIVGKLGGLPFSIETKFKSLYHAAAVTSAGHITALIDIAVEMLEKCGIQRAEGTKILLPLIRSTVKNLETQEAENALTGPYARMELQTFVEHLASLTQNMSPEIVGTYLELAQHSVEMTQKRTGKNIANLEMLERINIAKKNLKC